MPILVIVAAFIGGVAAAYVYFYDKVHAIKDEYEQEAEQHYDDYRKLYDTWESQWYELERLKHPIPSKEELVKKLEAYHEARG